MARKAKTVHMESDRWYSDNFERHECCDCGLEHIVRVRTRIVRGKEKRETQWERDDEATSRNRKRAGIKVTVAKTSGNS